MAKGKAPRAVASSDSDSDNDNDIEIENLNYSDSGTKKMLLMTVLMSIEIICR